MKDKMIKKIASVFVALIMFSTVMFTTASTAKADVFLNMIQRAGRACSSAQMEMDRIVNRRSYPTRTVPVEKVEEKKVSMTMFGVYSYIEHGTVHNYPEETVHRNNLPLYALMYQEGTGNICAITIDNVPLSTCLISEKFQADDNVDINVACAQIVVFDDAKIRSLSDGNHKIKIYSQDDYGNILSDNFTFNLTD